MFYRGVKKLFDFSEINDLIEVPAYFHLAHAQDGAVQENILPSCEFWMKAGAYFKQTGKPATNDHLTARRTGNPRQNFEQGAFACAVAPDYADHVALIDVETNVLQGPEASEFEFGSVSIAAREAGKWRFDAALKQFADVINLPRSLLA